jgi:TolB-like protein/DNA-binding winged helix-turn-helix (wHTH) protein
VRFGVFQLDLRTGELHKHGIRIRLQQQPFMILSMLLERPGEMVTREELRQALWPSDTFVDFDVGLDAAIYKLRQALNDTAENPIFIETLVRRGYRFIAPVAYEDASAASSPMATGTLPSAAGPHATLASSPGVVEVSIAHVTDPGGRQRRPVTIFWWMAGILMLLVVATIGFISRQHPTTQVTTPVVAVLPFKDLAVQPGSEYFSDGLTDEVIRNLSLIEGLQVRSRTSSFEFKDKPRNIRAIGAQLNANFVLEGSVLREAKRLRINVQLVRVTDDTPMWSGRYDRELKDIFEIQNEISRSIVNELRLQLGSGKRRYNANLEAYELYLQAQTFVQGGLVNPTRPGIAQGRRSLELFEQAIAKDPDFAPAYAGAAYTYARLSQSPRSFVDAEAWRGICRTHATCRHEVTMKMRTAAQRSVQIDPLLAEGHGSMGIVYARDRAWSKAESAFRRAIELNPNLAEVRAEFAVAVLLPLERFDDALQQARAAAALDPLSPRARNVVDLVLVTSGRYDEVLTRCNPMPPAVPDTISQQLCARALLQAGKVNEAIALFEKHEAERAGGPGFLAYAYAQAGRRGDAEKVVDTYPDFPWVHALAYAGLGDKERAFAALDRMAEIEDSRVAMYLAYPEMSSLRGDPRLSAFRRKLNLPVRP